MLRRTLAGFLDLMSPPTCAACGSPLAARTAGFCEACRPLLDIAPHTSGVLRDRDGYFYGGPLRDALHRLKYEGASELAPTLGALLVEPAHAFSGHIDCVTFVPLHPRKLRERGYNQSALLSRPVACALGVPLRSRLLARVRATATQVGKSGPARRMQLADAFLAHPSSRSQRILVVDDVRTTGSTLSAIRSVLEDAGARAVYTIALANASASHEEVDQPACL